MRNLLGRNETSELEDPSTVSSIGRLRVIGCSLFVGSAAVCLLAVRLNRRESISSANVFDIVLCAGATKHAGTVYHWQLWCQ
jgi:hypothetical protein